MAEVPLDTSSWYIPTLPTLPPVALEVFKKYTNLPEDEIIPHIIVIREKAWKIFPYPCIGTFRFLDFPIAESASYNSVVSRLKSGETLLDLGCCFGQDIRKLISDGVPSGNIYGADLKPEFINLGYDLFLDKETTQANFLDAVDIFDESPSSPLNALEGKIDIIHISAFLHLFSYDDQLRAAKRISKVLSQKKGSMVLGRQAGSTEPGEYVHRTNGGGSMFRHNSETFEKLWKEDVGGEWDVEAVLEPVNPKTEAKTGEPKEPVFSQGKGWWLRFSVKRV